jgi:hypothetical protein
MSGRRRSVLPWLAGAWLAALPAYAEETVLSGLNSLTGWAATWNPGAPKVVSDGLHTYAALPGFSGDPYSWSIVRKRGLESQWQQGAPVFRANQPPVLVLDRRGRLNVFDNTPQLRHLRFDHPAVDLHDYQSIPFPFSGNTGYLYAGYDAPSDTLMVVFSETSTWRPYFCARSSDGAWTTPAPLPLGPAGTIDLYARATRSAAGYTVIASEHPVGTLNAAYVAAVAFESPSPSGPWTRRDLYRVHGSNQGIPYQNFVFASDLQLDAQGRNRVLLHINENGSGHVPRPEGLYVAREEDGYQLRYVGGSVDDAFPLHLHPSGALFAFAKLFSGTGLPNAGKLVYFRSDDDGVTWGPAHAVSSDGIYPVAVGPNSGALSGGKEFGLIYSAPLAPPFHTVRYTTVPLSLADTANRFDFWRWGADGNRDYVRSYQEPGSGRSYHYTYDYHADGTFTITGTFTAGSYKRFYVAHPNGAVRYTDSEGYEYAAGPPAPPPCGAPEAPSAPVFVNAYAGTVTGRQALRWRWEPGPDQCGPIRSWRVCPDWGECVTLDPWISEFAASGIGPGAHVLAVQAENEHGRGPSATDGVTVCPYGAAGCAAATPGNVRVEPVFTSAAEEAAADGIRFKLEILENDSCSSSRSVVAAIRSHASPARDSYLVEPGLHATRPTYTDGLCAAGALCAGGACGAAPVAGEASFRIVVVDPVLEGRPGARTTDPVAFPRQTRGIEPDTTSYLTELTYQGEVLGRTIEVTVAKGPLVADAAGWRTCPLFGGGSTCECPSSSAPVPCPEPDALLTPEPYRQWDVNVGMGASTYSMAVALPEADGELGVLDALVGRDLNGPGAFRAHFWDLASRREGETAWQPVREWVVAASDGHIVDHGVRKVLVAGQERIEVKAGLPDVQHYDNGRRFFLGPPGVPVPSSPQGVVATNNPTYEWNPTPAASDYYLWVNDPAGVPVVREFYAAATVCGAATCSVTPSTVLANGAHVWWVQARNEGGRSAWSAPLSFTVDRRPPGTPAPTAPSGSISTPTPNYRWTVAAGATEYYLWVNGPGNTPVVQQWYDSSAVCGATSCSVTPTTTLGSANHRWWIQAKNSAGTGPWSAPMDFIVNTGPTTPPGASSPISPSGTITSGTPTYTWTPVSVATEYYLWVSNLTTGTTAIQQWYQSIGVCGATNCSVIPTTTLGSANYRWWIQTRNAVGAGPWSAPMDFTFNTGPPTPPGAPSPISPSGTITTDNPTYTWSLVSGASEFYLWVSNLTTGTPAIQQWYQSSAVCGATNCSVTPTTTLGSGNHRWWIQAKNSVGTGPWSASMDFTMNAGPTTPPGAATPISPSGTVATDIPIYTWAQVSGATEYYLWVANPSLGGPVLQQWYQASAVCGANDCSVTPTAPLPAAGYRWWIQTRNTAGTGPWSPAMEFAVVP